ncbi:MAG: hypothetical protein GXP62_05220 [Oligoflexia bacterium]|nr:hypothetical protein [Oligoflexia bacterium]
MMTDSEIERVDERTLRITPEGGFLASTMDQMFRGADDPFQLGQVIRRPDLSSTVASLTSDGRPSSVLISFDEPLDSDVHRFVAVVEGQLVPWTPPAVGERSSLQAGWLWPTLRPLGAHGPLPWP